MESIYMENSNSTTKHSAEELREALDITATLNIKLEKDLEKSKATYKVLHTELIETRSLNKYKDYMIDKLLNKLVES